MKINGFWFCLLACNLCFSQDNFVFFNESNYAVNTNISDKYRISFSARSRTYIYRDSHWEYSTRQVDLAHFSTYKLNYNHSLSLGVQYRFRNLFEDASNELRLTQQFNYTKKHLALRFGHRFRFEQRIFNNITLLRSRYRFTVDMPLNGQKTDIGETYLVASLEALLTANTTIKPQIDQRTTVQLGWKVTKKARVQAGFEYRFEEFNIDTQHVLFFLTALVLKI